ncbi:hypothetical protein [Methylobacterium sp. B4]|uniref:hypothetical protein n=1 Tax=Methylobacterium sp. B4 TaxID=1938755 RepID=UPI000D9259F8|nr:hypothetical protein [Methylobacterium sp. B4]PXW57727.1 hypothetical protein BY998_1134 [Methylobacterium sp. B4]
MTVAAASPTKRPYARLGPAQWAEVEELWASGAATLAELSSRYSVSARAMQLRFAKRGIVKGSTAAALGAQIRSQVRVSVLADTDDLAQRAVAIRENAFQGAVRIEQLLLSALDEAAADPSKLFALAATAKATALAAQTLERLHSLKRSALGLTDESTLDDDLPVLQVVNLTSKEIEAMREDPDDAEDLPEEENKVVDITFQS